MIKPTVVALAVVSTLVLVPSCKDSSSSSSSATDASGIAGAYKIASATNPGGAKGYTGSATIGKQGEHYTVDWNVSGSPAFKGVGIVEGNTLGVGWGTGANYGVAVYRVDGGNLTGKWATFASQGAVGSENLSGPSGLNGEYKIVSATSPPSGKSYAGTMTITPQGQTYAVTWKLANETYSGVGILRGNVFVVGWGTGGGAAGVVAYGVSAGKLDGTWAQPGSTATGTEVLAKN